MECVGKEKLFWYKRNEGKKILAIKKTSNAVRKFYKYLYLIILSPSNCKCLSWAGLSQYHIISIQLVHN